MTPREDEPNVEWRGQYVELLADGKTWRFHRCLRCDQPLVQVRRRGLTQTNVYRLLPALPPDRHQGSDHDQNSASD